MPRPTTRRAGQRAAPVPDADVQRAVAPAHAYGRGACRMAVGVWLFDSQTIVKFHFNDQDTTLGVEVSEDPTHVRATCQARDAAWRHAIHTAEFQAQLHSTG
ncbi:DUF6879 family protein [Streptomyces sp. NBC_01304]|uniref:DUF6879 family protein n=1 Tax=Streptomyces sp. NBC_01304 TaxID=2903818 RepID=UPI002E13EE3B|nr:DUF6879 family protein [Streptomyces sp. NBC_01304]